MGMGFPAGKMNLSGADGSVAELCNSPMAMTVKFTLCLFYHKNIKKNSQARWSVPVIWQEG